MANFSDKQKETILHSDEYAEFRTLNPKATLDMYLEIDENSNKWSSKFEQVAQETGVTNSSSKSVNENDDKDENKVIDLNSLDRYKETSEVAKAFADNKDGTEFSAEIAKALQLKQEGKTEEAKVILDGLQLTATNKRLDEVKRVMDEHGFMQSYINRPEPKEEHKVIDLNSLDRYKATSEVAKAFADNEGGSEFSAEIAKALQLKQEGKTDEAKALLDGLQLRATDKQLDEVKFVMDEHGFMESYIDRPEPKGIVDRDEIEKNDDELARIRSLTSDENRKLFSLTVGDVLHDMKEIDDQQLAEVTSSLEKSLEIASKADELSPAKKMEFDIRLGSKIADNEKLLQVTPPSILTTSHDALKNFIAKTKEKNPNANVEKYEQDLAKISAQMDSLSEQMDGKVGLFFADRTNIADVHDGYSRMFDSRKKDFGENPTPEEQAKISKMNNNRQILDGIIDEYDDQWNLKGLEEKDASLVNERFDEMDKILPELKVSEENKQLLSKYQFLDENKQPVPQFVDKEGNKHLDYQPGFEIAKDSQLATVVKLAANDEMLKGLGSKEDISKENMEKSLNENLPFKLFAIHNSEELIQGVKEQPDKFTNPKYAQEFVEKLEKSDKPMQISQEGYEAALDFQVNAVDGFAHRLEQKIGKQKAVLPKLYDKVSDIDKQAPQRTVSGLSKSQARIKQLKQAGTKFGMAAISAAVITTASTVSSATLGVPAAAASIGVGIGMTALQVYRKKKQAMKNGEKYGWKEFKKDKALQMSIATTSLGAAAVIFGATGNPGVAAACGYGALALGTTNGIISSYDSAKNDGLSKGEALFWGAVNGVATMAGAATGRGVANAGIDAYNTKNPDNEIFQHKETTVEPGKDPTTETVVDYEKLNDSSEDFLQRNWYKDNPDLLQQRLDALSAAGVENPAHALLISHDAGMIAPDNMTMYDGSTSNGNHTVLTSSWAQQNGVDISDVDNMKHLFNADGSVNTEAAKSYGNLAEHVGEKNFVSTIENRPVIRELYGDRESTYDNKPNIPTKEVEHPGTKPVETSEMVRNDGVWGMFGWSHSKDTARKLKERAGALADKIMGRKPQETSNIKQTPDNDKLAKEAEVKDNSNNVAGMPVTEKSTEVAKEQKITEQNKINKSKTTAELKPEKEGNMWSKAKGKIGGTWTRFADFSRNTYNKTKESISERIACAKQKKETLDNRRNGMTEQNVTPVQVAPTKKEHNIVPNQNVNLNNSSGRD